MSIILLSMSTLEDSVLRKGNAMFFGTILPASQLPSLLPSFTAFRFVLSAPRCRIQGGEWERHSVLSLYKFFWIGPSRSFVHLQTPPSSVCFWTFTLPHQILLKTCKHIGVKGGYIVKHGADRGCVVLCLRSFLWNTGTLPHFAIGHGNTSYLVSSLSCCMIENTSVIKTFRLQRAVELVSIVPEFFIINLDLIFRSTLRPRHETIFNSSSGTTCYHAILSFFTICHELGYRWSKFDLEMSTYRWRQQHRS